MIKFFYGKSEETASLPLQMKQLNVERPDGSLVNAYCSMGRNGDITPRPTIALLQGSGRCSVFGRLGTQWFLPLLARSLYAYRDDYNLVLIGRRGVTLGDFVEWLSGEEYFQAASREYVQHDVRNERAQDVSQVLSTLRDAGISADSGVLLIGSSEGAAVAASVASISKDVSLLAVAGFGGGQHLAYVLDALRKQLANDELTQQEFKKAYAETLETFTGFRESPDAIGESWSGHSWRHWASFAFHGMEEDLARTDIPILFAIPTHDRSVPPVFADLVVAEMIRQGKSNFTIRHYFNCDHGFFERCGDQHIERQGQLASDIISWAAETKGNWAW